MQDVNSLNAYILRPTSVPDVRRGPAVLSTLEGVAVGIKDNIDVAGMPTTAGTPALKEAVATHSATIVDRLLAEGAIVAGKTNMHELALGISSKNEAFGYVRNPHDSSRSAGGSSGGSAALVAAGELSLALGTDTAGSVRVPAAFCGCVGFRPTTGRYPAEGIVPLSRTRDTVGILARNVEDVALADATLAEKRFGTGLTAELPTRLGIAVDFRSSDLDQTIASQFDLAKNKLEQAGVMLVGIDMPDLYQEIARLAPPLTAYEVRRDLCADLEQRAPGLTLADLLASIASPDVAEQLQAMFANAEAVDDSDYQTILTDDLPRFRAGIDKALDAARVDSIVFPATPIVAFPLELQTPPVLATIRNLQTATLAGLPSISLPMPRLRQQMPGGLLIEGRAGADRALLETALAVERLLAKIP